MLDSFLQKDRTLQQETNHELAFLAAQKNIDDAVHTQDTINEALYANLTLGNISPSLKNALRAQGVVLPDSTDANTNTLVLPLVKQAIESSLYANVEKERAEALQIFDAQEKPQFISELGAVKTGTLIAATNLNKETGVITPDNIIQLPLM